MVEVDPREVDALSNEVTWSQKIGTTERYWQPPLSMLF